MNRLIEPSITLRTRLLSNLFLKSTNGRSFFRRHKSDQKKPFSKILVSNRGEIAVRIMRAAKELDIKTVAIYSSPDAKHHHRLAADEAYLLAEDTDPVSVYLDGPSIVKLARRIGVDAIHPGYGFLSEQADFVRECDENEIKFIGPSERVVRLCGNKVECRKLAQECQVAVIPGTENAITSLEEVEEFVERHSLPIIFKAAYGGGGRGMRVCRDRSELASLFQSATSEAKTAFGNGALFVERFIEKPRHIEVQILGDDLGNVVHLSVRDCSIQRRYQKVIEIAPAPFLAPEVQDRLTEYAVRLCRHAGYQNAGTVEFLLDQNDDIYFIEINSRVQVEHTVTEEVTGVDIVKTQIKLSEGRSLSELGLDQADITTQGFSLQVRVTTEDPKNNFVPDLGRISLYQPGGGPGIRLDGACGFSGAVISPYYDSLLTKVISKGTSFEEATKRMLRCLEEFRVEGVKTNIPYIINVLKHPEFTSNFATTDFIAKHPELAAVDSHQSDESRLLNFLATVVVNGAQTPLGTDVKPAKITPSVPAHSNPQSKPSGWRDVLKSGGPSGLAKAIIEHGRPLLTDTTLRDAHQSLLATRMRTYDMKRIMPFLSHDMNKLFSLECWGGATFDVSMRFLRECPWERLAELRELSPNIPFQMLLRGANTVGYKNYPDNVLYEFCRLAVREGMDVFRIFDALNYSSNIKIAMDAVNKAGGVVEAAMSYSGDISDPNRKKYTLEYYMGLAEELVSSGAHILCIKDMSGVLRPQSATLLVSELRKAFPNTPIHIHTHDTAGTGVATHLAAIQAGAHIVDVACDSMSGMTSQPSMGAVVAALYNSPHQSDINLSHTTKYSAYFEQTRMLYGPFESTVTMKSGNADVYVNEIPGGQYTNLQFQAFSLGLGDQFEQVKQKYVIANQLLGDIIKVTPTSKVVGDLAQFMVQNNLSYEDVVEKADTLNFPNSVIEFLKGEMGQPYGGFPEPLRTKVLKGQTFLTERPGSILPPMDLNALSAELKREYGERNISDLEVMSYALYPDVFKEYMAAKAAFGPVSKVPTRFFFDSCEVEEEVVVDLSPAKRVYLRLKHVGQINQEGKRELVFEVNGSPMTILVADKNAVTMGGVTHLADPSNQTHVGAPMPGTVVKVNVKEGAEVQKGDVLFVLSAMKMETDVTAHTAGTVEEIHVRPQSKITAGTLLCVLNPNS